MKKFLIPLLVLITAFARGQSQATMQFTPQNPSTSHIDGIPYFYPGKFGGKDTLINAFTIRSLYKGKSDSTGNSGYVTHGYLNAQSGSRSVNIYNSDGILTGDRNVDVNGRQLNFNIGNAGQVLFVDSTNSSNQLQIRGQRITDIDSTGNELRFSPSFFHMQNSPQTFTYGVDSAGIHWYGQNGNRIFTADTGQFAVTLGPLTGMFLDKNFGLEIDGMPGSQIFYSDSLLIVGMKISKGFYADSNRLYNWDGDPYLRAIDLHGTVQFGDTSNHKASLLIDPLNQMIISQAVDSTNISQSSSLQIFSTGSGLISQDATHVSSLNTSYSVSSGTQIAYSIISSSLSKSIVLTTNLSGISIRDDIDSVGMEYPISYYGKGHFSDFWVPDWGSVKAYADSVASTNGGSVSSVFSRSGAVTAQSGDYNTSQVTESGNLYFTDARTIGALLTGYTSGAGTVTATDNILQAMQKLNGNVVGLSSVYYPLSGNPSGFLTANQNISFAPTGDVTGSTSGVTSLMPTLSIGTGKVTNTMLAGNIASSKLIGTDITVIGTITAGSVPYSLITGAPSSLPTPNSLTPNYGLIGSTFNGSSAQGWIADTSGTHALVSKDRLTANLSGYVKSVSITTSNGVSASSSGGQTPALSFTLGAITPTSLSTTIKPSTVYQTTAGTAGTDSIMVKHSGGIVDAISPTFYQQALTAGRGIKIATNTITIDTTKVYTFKNAAGGGLNIDVTGSTTSAPSIIGLTNLSSGTAAQVQFGDANNSLQTAFNSTLQLNSYWGIELGGNREGAGPQSFNSGISTTPSVTIYGTTVGANILNLVAPLSQTASILKWNSSAGSTTIGSVASDGALASVKFKGSKTAINTSATITSAQLQGGVLTSTSASAVTMTLPTATSFATQIVASQGTWFDFEVDNTAGANTVTIALGTGMTAVSALTGGTTLTVPSGTSGVAMFRITFVSTTACVVSRLL